MTVQTDDFILDMYISETSQLVEQLEKIVLESEQSDHFSESIVNEIFRIMHTIKGSAAMMNHHNIATLAHSLEDIFTYIREQGNSQLPSISELSDIMLESVDFIKGEIQKAKQLEVVDGEASLFIQKAESYFILLKTSKQGNGTTDESNLQTLSKSESTILHSLMSENSDNTSPIFHATVYFEDDCQMENIRAFQIVQSLKEIVEEYRHIPEDIKEFTISGEMIRKQGFQLFFRTEKSYEEIYELFLQSSYLKELELKQIQETVEVENGHLKGDQPKQQINLDEPDSKEEILTNYSQNNSINVNVLKLDELMDLVGELVIAEAMVTQNPELSGLPLEQFRKAARHLQKITHEIQDKVMAIRMVPLSNTFQKMHRVIRDMSKKLGKSVNLRLIGEETEMDKNIIEHISDPIMHLVRNAVDHGIETTQERIESGKSEPGLITLEAKNLGGEVIIHLKDDGRGLDKNKILKKAKENQILLKDPDKMTDKEIYQLILLPGFSTKENITEFSGRGVGMDVVVQNISAVGGSVSIESVVNQGTTISIRIPLTLAIIDGMNIRVGQSYYTLPTTAIKESFRPNHDDLIRDPDGNEMIMVRGQVYPILRLHQFYHIKTETVQINEGVLVMVEQDEQFICLFVDELLGQQQVVVKSLPPYIKKLNNITGISGCTLLGDGSISLILDISGLAKARK
ncbi:chemotaxis protein CheW [Pseudoneobacillus sp. C159]